MLFNSRNSVRTLSMVVSKEEVKENDMHIIEINFRCLITNIYFYFYVPVISVM